MRRCFLSIKLPEEISEKIYYKVNKKFEKVLKGKEISPDQYHLTLKFFGNLPDEKILEVKKELREIDFPSFEIKLGKLNYFETPFRGILYIELAGNNLKQLVKKIWGKVGWEKRKFKSHVTLFRFKKCLDKIKLMETMKKIKIRDSFVVDRFYLMESKLTPDGPKYFVLDEFPLN